MLINCAVYQEGRKLTDLPIEQISDYLLKPDCFVWVGLKDPDDAELEAMRKEFGLHELAVEDARRGHQRPKIEEYGESLFVVLHTMEFRQGHDLSFGELDIFVGPNYVLSVRSKTQRGFTSIRERCEREPNLLRSGPAFILYALMDSVVDRYFPIVEEFERQLEGIEEKIFSRSASVRLNIEEVYSLKRKLTTMQRSTSSLLEAVGKLHGGRVPKICHPMQDYFRDVSDHVIRITKSIESIREMTSTAIQVNLSMISQGESEVTKKLASYGALFALPTSIAGIYGMNFKFMPELEWTLGYPLVWTIIIVTDALLWWRFRRAGWL